MAAVFREKSLERMRSPERLDEYIHVSNPSVWVILGAIVLLLAAGFVWSCVGTITERAQAIVVVSGGQVTAYVAQADSEDVSPGQTIELTESLSGAQVQVTGVISSLDETPVAASSLASAATAQVVADRLGSPSWLVSGTVTLASDDELADGAYAATVVTRSYQPVELLLGGL